ncbi:helix-turn-helix domain-containing protein [Vibrio sp. CUB2]|uniref:helix-turn-helix domain-containing protein n=1 Tax=Vibrio sp. CUB2 TaxID=2315233 RepID=UPI00076AC189|nr:helix-turn-helix domain-containing protein [Vibrio sp. CUB2]
MTNQFLITKEIIEANLKQTHGITATEKCVLITLSSYFGDREMPTVFTCYPSQNRIAREVGCTRSTVNSALQKFERLRFLRANYRSTPEGGNTSKLYTWLGIPTTEELESESSDEPSESDVVETRTEVEEALTEMPVVVEPTPALQPESSHESVPASDWWADVEEAIAEDESPF